MNREYILSFQISINLDIIGKRHCATNVIVNIKACIISIKLTNNKNV